MELSTQEIVRLEADRQIAAFKEIAPEWIDVADGVACYAGPGSWCNRVMGLGLRGPVSDEALDQLDAFYEGRDGHEAVELWPYGDPSLGPRLARRGFQFKQFENLLARPLDPGEDLSAPLPPGLEVRPIRPGEEELFVRVAHSGFHPDQAEIPAIDLELGLRIARSPIVVSVLALVNGVAAGAGSAEVRGPVASLFGASVLPAFRRRGLQGALLRARLQQAQARGAVLASIGSLPGEPTERNTARLGFRVAFTGVHLERRRDG